MTKHDPNGKRSWTFMQSALFVMVMAGATTAITLTLAWLFR